MPRSWTRLSVRSLLLLVALAAIMAGLRTRMIDRQRRAVQTVRQLGGQLEDAPLTVAAWLKGNTTPVDELSFLGPEMGDESIDHVVQAVRVLAPARITLMETRVSPRGQEKLRKQLPRVDIESFTPVLFPTDFERR